MNRVKHSVFFFLLIPAVLFFHPNPLRAADPKAYRASLKEAAGPLEHSVQLSQSVLDSTKEALLNSDKILVGIDAAKVGVRHHGRHAPGP